MRLHLLIALFFITSSSANAQNTATELTLAQALSHTRDSSPALAAAKAELEAAREIYPQARAGWKPTIDADASIYRSDIDNSNFGNR